MKKGWSEGGMEKQATNMRLRWRRRSYMYLQFVPFFEDCCCGQNIVLQYQYEMTM